MPGGESPQPSQLSLRSSPAEWRETSRRSSAGGSASSRMTGSFTRPIPKRGAPYIRHRWTRSTSPSRFATALGLGLLLGFERERRKQASGERFAGVRTFALVSLLGATAVHAAHEPGLAWLPLAAFLAVALLAVASHVVTALGGDVGGTTEVSLLLVYLLGGLCVVGQTGVATALAVVVLLLLAIKEWSHGLAAHIEAADVEATLKFALITAIVLPILPDQAFGPEPLKVINPYKIWRMVVLISGLNFLSYLLVKLVGREHGIGLTGLLGGLVSSTAVTLGFAQRSRREPDLAAPLSLGILLAWTLMFFRVLIVVLVVSPGLARHLAAGLGVVGLASLVIVTALWRRHESGGKSDVQAGSNPFELGEAIKFGLLFGVVTFGARAAEYYLGSTGLYLAGALAGLTDVDAISLSMATLAQADPSRGAVAARTILIAVLANTAVKTAMSATLGAEALRRRMVPIGGILLGCGIGAAYLIG